MRRRERYSRREVVEVLGNIKDCQTRFKIAKNEEYHKYSETCKRLCDDINKILNEINK